MVGTRINSRHTDEEIGENAAYFTPPEAIQSLLILDKFYIPQVVWEPACGDGAISKELEKDNKDVYSSDIVDYGYPGTKVCDFFKMNSPYRVRSGMGIITNPPYSKTLPVDFVKKAVRHAGYVAMLLRLSFMEGERRHHSFWGAYKPSVIYLPSRRLPMMHRFGWTGKRSSSNSCHCWYVWDIQRPALPDADFHIVVYDWQEVLGRSN